MGKKIFSYLLFGPFANTVPLGFFSRKCVYGVLDGLLQVGRLPLVKKFPMILCLFGENRKSEREKTGKFVVCRQQINVNMDSISLDLLLYVGSFLPDESYLALAGVCRGWRHALLEQKRSMAVSVGSDRRGIYISDVFRLCAAWPNIWHVHIRPVANFGRDPFIDPLLRLPHLRSLSFQPLRNARNYGQKYNLRDFLVAKRDTLESLRIDYHPYQEEPFVEEFHGYAKLSAVCFSGCSFGTLSSIYRMQLPGQTLQTLAFRQCDIRESDVAYCIQHLPMLRTFIWEPMDNHYCDEFLPIASIIGQATYFSLQHLYISDSVHSCCMNEIVRCSSLQSLHLSEMWFPCVAEKIGELENLKILHCIECTLLLDSDIERICERSMSITTIRFDGCKWSNGTKMGSFGVCNDIIDVHDTDSKLEVDTTVAADVRAHVFVDRSNHITRSNANGQTVTISMSETADHVRGSFPYRRSTCDWGCGVAGCVKIAI